MNQKVFMIILIVSVLVIILGYGIKIFLDYKKYTDLESGTKFPPWPSKCPDYWAVVGKDKCKNIHKIGICKAGDTDNVMDFSEPLFQGTKGMYYKCNWSKKCNAPWEGIDNLC